MPKFLTVPAADGDDLSNGVIHNSTVLSGLSNGTSYICYRLSAPSDAFVPVAGAAPVITQQPSITPSSATVGDSVTINLGAATGADGPPTWTLMLGSTDVTAQAIGDPLAYEATAAGTLTLAVTWSNDTGSTVATPAVIEVEDAPSPGVDLSDAAIYIPDTSDPAADLTLPLVAQGRLAANFAETAGGGTLQSSPRGIEFDGTNGLILNDVDISSGYYMVGIATWDGLVGSQTWPVFAHLRTSVGNVMQIRRNGSNLQANWNYGTATNSDGGAMPSLTIGTPVVFGVEVDPVAGTVRTWNGTAFASKALGASGALETSILRLGRDQAATNFIDGAIKDFTFETLGASQAVTFEQALSELGAPVTPPFP
ncbi:hypothetical protein PE067_16275 [Paracoccus sp. DMF-8]|uniref:hypothetical protein n=1 Tax=Paracoccus sp. DMF-8 TaxID=3019445 RepID=UPI0023E460FE|nr:hypothetical protein [Paracoccus sp. DMF-8]MDF3607565.1 hypothetical protein [Paracoccus sp. DMF-8]